MNQLTLTVNPSTGTDTPSGSRPASLLNGDYSAFPFQTVQAALDASDKHSGVKITISAGTVSGFLAQGFSAPIEIIGTNSTVTPASGVASGTAGAGTNNTGIKKPAAAANWTVDDLRGALVVITGGAGFYNDDYIPFFGPCARRIVGNTIDTLQIDSWGFGTLDATTTFQIVRPATLVNAYSADFQKITFCMGAVDMLSRASLRNLKPNTAVPMYSVLAQNVARFEGMGLDLPSLGGSVNHMSAVNCSNVFLACNDLVGSGTEVSFLTNNQSVKVLSTTAGDVQIYVKETSYAYLQVDAKASAHRVVRPSYCDHVVLDVRANNATATVVDANACGYVETVRLTGSNPSIGASGPAVTIDLGGKYDFSGANITGPTTATLRVGSNSFVSWADLAAGAYVKGDVEVTAATNQNPLVPARVMPKLMAGNTDATFTAAGTTQATATPLTKPVTKLTTGNQNTQQGVRLPSANTADVPFYVFNDITGANAGTVGIRVYPESGETIEPLAMNAGDLLQPGMVGMYFPLGGGKWRLMNLPTKQDATSMTASGIWYFYQTARFQTQIACNSFAPQAAADMQCIGGLTNSFTFKDNDTGNAMMTFDTSNDLIRSVYAFQEKRRVTALTANTTLVALDSGRSYNNTGATGVVTVTLPAAAAGLHFRLRVTAAQELRVQAASGASIQFDSANAPAANYFKCSTVGGVLELECQDGALWVVTSARQTWTKV